MLTQYEMVREFHEIYDCMRNTEPTHLPLDTMRLRLELIKEEVREVEEAMDSGDLRQIVDLGGGR